jgi:hypothetical protein
MKGKEERFCTNCRAELPPDAETCPACGVFAGDLYDERVHRPRTRFVLFGTVLVLALAAGGAAIWWNAMHSLPGRPRGAKARPPSVRVVGDRPGGARRAAGAAVNEAEAMRLVRRHLVTTTGVKTECLALITNRMERHSYLIAVVDRCEDTRLGKWRVDGASGAVTPAR